MTAKHHSINYIEFPAKDIQATKDFYGQVFNWQFTDWGPDYTSFTEAEIGGGFRADGDVKPAAPGVLVVLYSDDLAATEKLVVDAGGKIVVPSFEFPGGRRFHFADPNGNELAVWSK